ncbi:hypothetical protein EDI_083900 [Entamoeba dispar SAW760]|uniref:Serine-threonine-isoleucine rich protein n=1 Tax=Entamoeba dispar (strain ATCC PRA-260 / SAW760) TaxID=370354 RepID=B0EPB9_ENTDS|nr:uncharacterized protein EDI_083900 [Entamoeba dispar SAW760]EDR23623.1 hypothetical protein EDI_083900 [Entamoeba dispar SAW760]|eukprot:EDR23623.1 hypothetical protein EDI_083900 [Entamoeba dispar SAW760]
MVFYLIVQLLLINYALAATCTASEENTCICTCIVETVDSTADENAFSCSFTNSKCESFEAVLQVQKSATITDLSVKATYQTNSGDESDTEPQTVQSTLTKITIEQKESTEKGTMESPAFTLNVNKEDSAQLYISSGFGYVKVVSNAESKLTIEDIADNILLVTGNEIIVNKLSGESRTVALSENTISFGSNSLNEREISLKDAYSVYKHRYVQELDAGLCTFSSDSFTQNECSYLSSYNQMKLDVIGQTYPTALDEHINNKEWNEINFKTTGELTIPGSVTITANKLHIDNKFTINCLVTVTTLEITADPKNIISKDITVSEISPENKDSVYFVLTESAKITKKETQTQSDSFVAYKLSSSKSRVVSPNNEDGKNCVYEETGGYTSSDCDSLEVGNEIIFKIKSVSAVSLEYKDGFKTKEFKGIDLTLATKISTIKGFKLASFELTKTGFKFVACEIGQLSYKSNIPIDYLLFTGDSKVTDIVNGQSSYLFTADSQNVLGESEKAQVVKVKDGYYRYSFSNSGAVCTLTCLETEKKCKFVEGDCRNKELVDTSLMTLKFSEQSFTLYPIESPNNNEYKFKECTGITTNIEKSDLTTQVITCSAFTVDHITIKTDKLVINSFETTGNTLSILTNLPATVTFKSSLDYFILNSAQSEEKRCTQIANEYMRCGSQEGEKPTNDCLVKSITENSYEQEDCSSEYIDLSKMILVFSSDPGIKSDTLSEEKTFKGLRVDCKDCTSFSLNAPKYTFIETFDISKLTGFFFTINAKVSSGVSVELPSNVNGYLILDGATKSSIQGSSLTGSLYTNINKLKCFNGQPEAINVEGSYYWYDNTHICTYETTSFNSEICKLFSTYEKVDVVINTPSTITTSLSVKTLSFSDGASTKQPNIKCQSVTVSKDTELSEVFGTLTMNGNENGITVTITESVGKASFNGENIKLVAKTIKSYELTENAKGIRMMGALEEGATVQDGIFYGSLSTYPNSLNKVQMGDNFYRFSKESIDAKCTYKNSVFEEYDCQKFFNEFNTEEYVTIDFQGTSGSTQKTYNKCIISTTQALTSLNCKQTEIIVDTFTITESKLGELTMKSQNSFNKKISTSTITKISLSDSQTSNIPIFYGSGNTVSESTLYYFETGNNAGRYYFKEEGAITVCEYSNNGFNMGDCDSVQSLDLNIKGNGFSVANIKYNTVNVEKDVTSIKTINAKKLVLSCSSIIIDSITVDELTLPDDYSDYYFKAGKISTINGGLSPLFIGGTNDMYSSEPSQISDNRYRYFKSEVGHKKCTCSDNNKFTEWDCQPTSTYYTPEAMTLVCEKTFVFNDDSKKFASFVLETEGIELTNLKVKEVTVNAGNYKLVNVDIEKLTISKEFNGGIISGTITNIQTSSGYSSNVIMYYTSDTTPSFEGYYSHKIGDTVYRISKEEKFYCTLKSGVDSIIFEEKDCNEEYTGTNKNKILKLSYNPSSLTFNSPYNEFDSLESSVNELVLNGLTLHTFSPSDGITSFSLSIAAINNFNVGKLTNYMVTVTDKISNMIISTNPKDARIKGTVDAVETSLVDGSILFVLEGTPATDSSKSNYNSVKISDKLYRITKGTNTKCTYVGTDTTSPFAEFDCNLYATNMESPLLVFVYSGSETIKLTSNKFNTFESATLGSSTKIENLKTTNKASFSNSLSTLSLDNCQFGTLDKVDVTKFTFTSCTIGTLIFSTAIAHEGSMLTGTTITTINNAKTNSILCVGDSLSVITNGFYSYGISENKKRFSSMENDKYCTLTKDGSYEEWDCNENYAENNYLYLKITSSADLPKFPAIFKGVEFSTNEVVKITNANPVTFSEYTIDSSKPIITFSGTVTLSSLIVDTDTPKFSYFNSLTITDVKLNKSPNYILTSGNSPNIPNSIYSFSTSDSTNRISSKSNLECTYVSDCSFTESDCNGYGEYSFLTSKADIVFNNENEISYTCSSKQWKSVSYNSGSSLSLKGQPFSVDSITLYSQISVTQKITVVTSCNFVNGETNKRNLNLVLKEGATFSVLDSDTGKDVVVAETNENVPSKNYLFDGTLDGFNPENMYLLGCGQTTYYYKKSKSDYKSSWIGANVDDCYQRTDKVTSYSLAFSSDFNGEVVVDVDSISFVSIKFGNLDKVSFVKKASREENVELTIDTLIPCDYLSFGPGISVKTTNVGSNAAGFIFAESITVEGTAESIIISKNNDPISGLTKTSITDFEGYSRNHPQSDRGLNCNPGDTADCVVSKFSSHYTYQADKQNEIILASSFKEIVSNLEGTDELTISKKEGIADEVVLSTFTAKCKTQIQNVQIDTFVPSGKYVTLTLIPKHIQDTDSFNYYYSSSIVGVVGSEKQVRCGDYYRTTKDDVQCKCYSNSLLPDCEQVSKEFDYVLKTDSQSSAITYKIDKLWKSVSFDKAFEGDIINLESSNNIISVPSVSVKITGTSSKVSLDYSTLNDVPFIDVVDVIVTKVTGTNNVGSQVLFGSNISPESSVSFATCFSNYYRAFADSASTNCRCVLGTADTYDKNDCALRSSSLDLDVKIAAHTVSYPWNSINIVTTSTLTLDKDKIVKTINQNTGSELILHGEISTEIALKPSGLDYLYVDVNVIGDEGKINVQGSCTYCLNAKSKSYLTLSTGLSVTQCSETNYRVGTDIGCYCKLKSSNSNEIKSDSIDYVDCRKKFPDLSDYSFDLEDKSVLINEDISLKEFTNIVRGDISIGGTGSLKLSSLSLNQQPLTFSGSTVTIASATILTNGKLLDKTTTKMEISSLKLGSSSGPFILSYGGKDKSFTVTSQIETTAVTGFVTVAYANHLAVSFIEQNYLNTVTSNGKTTVYLGVDQVPSSTVTCSLDTYNEVYDSQFSTINCPCDGDNCIIDVKDTVKKVYLGNLKSKSEWLIHRDTMLSTSSGSIQHMTIVPTTKTSISTDSSLTIQTLSSDNSLLLTGDFIIGEINANLVDVASGSTVVIDKAKFKSLVSKSGSTVKLKVQSDEVNNFELDCVNCEIETLSSTDAKEQVITKLTIGNSRSYKFLENAVFTINEISVDQIGSLELLHIDKQATLKFEYTGEHQTFNYPILIAELSSEEKLIVPESDDNMFSKLCSPSKLFIKSKSSTEPLSEICHFSGQPQTFTEDNADNCKYTPVCILEIKEDITDDLKANYDRVICKSDVKFSTNKDVTVECDTLHLVTITNSGTEAIKVNSIKCNLKLVGGPFIINSLSDSDNVNIIVEGDSTPVTINSGKCGSISTSSSLTITGDLIISSITASSLSLSSGSIICSGAISVTGQIDISSLFIGPLKADSLNAGSISGNTQFLNHAIKSLGNNLRYNDYYIIQKDEEESTKTCHTVNDVLDISEIRYLNNDEHKCTSDNSIPVNILSNEIVVSSKFSSDRIFKSDLSNVMFTGSGPLTLNNFKVKNGRFFVDSDITASGSCTGSVYTSGKFNGFDKLTIDTTEDVTINYANEIEIQNVGTLNINGKNEKVTKIIIHPDKFSDSHLPVINVIAQNQNGFSVSYTEGISSSGFIAIKSSSPLTLSSVLNTDKLLCNDRILYHKATNSEVIPHISCDDELVKYDSDLNADPYECKKSNGLNCVASYTGSAASLDKIDAQTLIIENVQNQDSNNEFVISSKVNDLTVKGSGKVGFTYLPSTLSVESSVSVTFTLSSNLFVPHYITGSAGSSITIKCNNLPILISSIRSEGSVSFEDCYSVSMDSGDSVIDGIVKVNQMKVVGSKFTISSDFEVESLTVSPNSNGLTIFTLNSITDKFIVNSVVVTGNYCTILLNTRNLVLEPVISIPGFTSSERIYYQNCGSNQDLLKFDSCALRNDLSSVDSLNIQESAYYQYYSICPDPNKTIDLSSVSIKKLNGLEGDKYKSIILGSDVSMQSSTSSSIVIEYLEFSGQITLQNKYHINTLSCKGAESSIVVSADTVIDEIVAENGINITIKPNVILTYNGKTSLLINKLSIESATGLCFSAPNAALDFKAIDFSPAATVSSSFINVNSVNKVYAVTNSSKITGKYPILTSSTEISLVDIGSVSVGCNSRTLLFSIDTESSTAFVCPEVITCVNYVDDKSSNCARDSTNKGLYVQQYKYVYNSEYQSTKINLPNNDGLTPLYDIVEITGNQMKNVFIQNGGSYLLDIASSCSGGAVNCISDNDESELSCSVRFSLNDGSISLNGKGIVVEEDSTYEFATNSLLNIPKDAVVDISSIVGTTVRLAVQDKGTVNIVKYGSFIEILMSGDSVINAYDAFDSTMINYYGGKIVVHNNNIITLKIINIYEGSISNHECQALIQPSGLSSESKPEKIWEGNVPISSIIGIKYYQYLGAVLEACVNSTSEHHFKDVSCSATSANSPICYCSYDPYVDQSCILDCSDAPDGECVFRDEDSNSPLFNEIDFGGAQKKLRIESSMKLFRLNDSDQLEIEAVVPITVYSIEDSSDSPCLVTISGSNTLLSIERIHLVNPSSVVILNVREISVRELYIENAHFETTAVITISENDSPLITFSDAYDTDTISLPTVERKIVMKNADITFRNQGGVVVYGPSKNETIVDLETNSHYDADFNPTIIEKTKIHLLSENNACYESNTTKTQSVIYFDVVGRISVSDIEVDYDCLSNGNSENAVANLIYTNIPNYITISGSLSKNLRVDDQKYIILLAAKDFNGLEQYNIPELSCVVSDTFRSSSFSETASDVWSSPTCPCTGNGCIIDTTKPTVAVRYNLDSKQLDKYSAKYGTMTGSNVTIHTLVIQGSQEHDNYAVTCSLTKSNITELKLENYGKILFDESQSISNITGDTDTPTSVTLKNSITLRTNEIRNTNLALVGSTISLRQNSVGDFSGKTIKISSNGHFDLYSSNVEFTKDTTFDISFNSPGQSHSVSVDDDVSGNSLSILNAKFVVHIPSGHSGCTFAFLRINQPVDNVDKVLTSSSSKLKTDNNSFKFYSLCGGLVISDLPEDQVSCPSDRMARSTETKEFPMYMIAVIVIFFLVLVVVAILFIVYIVHVYLVRKRNLKVFEEGEEIDIDDNKKEEEIENKPTETKADENKDTTA